jgi:dipeptidyl aminopeptidase/acylaminoacyl peptidase
MDGALYTIDLATGAWTRLDYQRDPHDTDLAPTYSPDGRWIAFHRNVSVSDLWRVPATGGKPERLTNLGTNINSIAWAPDGKSIVFGMYLDGNVTLARLDLTSRRVTDLGVPKTLAVSVAAKVPSAAFVITDPHSAIFSIDLTNPGAGAQPVFPSTGVDLLPAIAPDGTQIAFVSDRSAVVGLWWARSDRPESLRLVDGVIPIPRYAPVWSADSTRVLVIGRTDADRGLYEVAVESGSVRHLPVPAGDPVQADYLPDPSRLLVVADRGAGRLAVTLYDRSTTPWKAIRTLDDISLARLDGPRNRVLFTRASTAGLWQADTELRGVSKISERPAFGGGRRLIFSRDKVELVAPSETCGMELVVIEHESQPPRCLYKPPLALSGVSLDAVHNRLYYSSEKDDNSDIGWLHLPRLADDAAKPAVAGLVTR